VAQWPSALLDEGLAANRAPVSLISLAILAVLVSFFVLAGGDYHATTPIFWGLR
jgi:hypothetical protein